MASPPLDPVLPALLHPEGERKQVTVLVGALDDTAGLAALLGDEAMYCLMQDVLALARREVQRYEGLLTEVRGNGFMALFGAPLAHEDHAQRAGLAALALQQCLQEHAATLGLPHDRGPGMRMGLHTGWVVVGPSGDQQQTPYVAVNTILQLAERLQQCAAPGVVLASAATATVGPACHLLRALGSWARDTGAERGIRLPNYGAASTARVLGPYQKGRRCAASWAAAASSPSCTNGCSKLRAVRGRW